MTINNKSIESGLTFKHMIYIEHYYWWHSIFKYPFQATSCYIVHCLLQKVPLPSKHFLLLIAETMPPPPPLLKWPMEHEADILYLFQVEPISLNDKVFQSLPQHIHIILFKKGTFSAVNISISMDFIKIIKCSFCPTQNLNTVLPIHIITIINSQQNYSNKNNISVVTTCSNIYWKLTKLTKVDLLH